MCLVGWDKVQTHQSPSPGIVSGPGEMGFGCVPHLDLMVESVSVGVGASGPYPYGGFCDVWNLFVAERFL